MPMYRSPFVIMLLVLMLVLAACDSGEEDALPTAFVVPEQTTDETDSDAVDDADAADDVDEAEAADDVIETDEPVETVAAPEPEDEPQPPATPAEPDADDMAEVDDATDDEQPAGPPFDTSGEVTLPADPPGFITDDLPFAGGDPITDFSELELGVPLLLVGELRIEQAEEGAGEILLLIDEAGEELFMIFPPPAAQPYDGEMVEVLGVLDEPTDASDDRRVLLPSSVQAVGAREAFEAGGLPPFMEGSTSSPLALMMDLLTPLEIELEPELTALGAYDALIDALDDELEGLDWVALRGDSSAWFIDFRDAEAEVRITYVVTATGDALVAEPETDIQLPGALIDALERERIVADSDQIEAVLDELEADADGPPIFATPQIELRAGLDDSIIWIVFSFDMLTFDATAEVSSLEDAISVEGMGPPN